MSFNCISLNSPSIPRAEGTPSSSQPLPHHLPEPPWIRRPSCRQKPCLPGLDRALSRRLQRIDIHPEGSKNSPNHSGLNILGPNQLGKYFPSLIKLPCKHFFFILNSSSSYSSNLLPNFHPLTTLFAICRSSFIPGARFYLSRHLSSSPHAKVTSKISWPSLNIFLPSLMPPFHQLTIPFAVRRSFSIPEAGFPCPANHPHHHTPRSHPECLDPLSISLNSRAHLQPLPNDTQNQFIGE